MSGNGRRELLPTRKLKLKSNGPCGTSGAVRDANRHIVTWATTCVSVDIKQRQGNLWAGLHSCWGHPVMHEQWSNGEQWLQFDWEGVEGRIREELRGAGGGEWLGCWHFGAARIAGGLLCSDPHWAYGGLWRRQYALRGYSLLLPLWRNITSVWGTILTIF
jgi:hypothetical protein